MPAAVWVPALISGAAGIGGAAIASHGNTSAAKTNAEASDKAAELQAQSADKALAQAKEIYQQQRADQGPYRQSGYGSLNALNFGLGLPAVDLPSPASPTAVAQTSGTLPSSTVAGSTFPGAPQFPTNTLSALGQMANGGGLTSGVSKQLLDKLTTAQQTINQKYGGPGTTVKIRNPQNGLVYLVPSEKAAEAQSAGGVLV